MPADDVVTRAARNAFLALLISLVGIAVYQFVTRGGIAPEVTALWVLGVAVYGGSTWYYRRGNVGDASGDGS